MSMVIGRVKSESKELGIKVDRLRNFLYFDGYAKDMAKLSVQDMDLLRQQYFAMRQYRDILNLRIAIKEAERE